MYDAPPKRIQVNSFSFDLDSRLNSDRALQGSFEGDTLNIIFSIFRART